MIASSSSIWLWPLRRFGELITVRPRIHVCRQAEQHINNSRNSLVLIFPRIIFYSPDVAFKRNFGARSRVKFPTENPLLDKLFRFTFTMSNITMQKPTNDDANSKQKKHEQ